MTIDDLETIHVPRKTLFEIVGDRDPASLPTPIREFLQKVGGDGKGDHRRRFTRKELASVTILDAP